MRAFDRPNILMWRSTVAKEFSPRLQRYGSDCVVLDVSGLGRLLGDPQTIGEEIAEHFSTRMRITDHSHGTRITRMRSCSRDADHADHDMSRDADLARISSDHSGERGILCLVKKIRRKIREIRVP